MAHENEEEEVVETPPKAKPKLTLTLTLVVALSIAVGVLLTLLIGGAMYHFRSGVAQSNELAATKEELKRKTLQVGDLQEQIAGLSSQMHALKDFAIAKASSAVAAAADSSSEGTAAPAPATVETPTN